MGQNSKYALDKCLPSAEWKCGVGVSGAEPFVLLKEGKKCILGAARIRHTMPQSKRLAITLKDLYFPLTSTV